MSKLFTTRDVVVQTGLTEPGLRHVLRRPGAPRPAMHPSARVFLWTEEDVQALIAFLDRSKAESEVMESRDSEPPASLR